VTSRRDDLAYAIAEALPDSVNDDTAVMLVATSAPTRWRRSGSTITRLARDDGDITIHIVADIPLIWNQTSVAHLVALLIDKIAEERRFDTKALALQIASIKAARDPPGRK
jgi:hypothetical protein